MNFETHFKAILAAFFLFFLSCNSFQPLSVEKILVKTHVPQDISQLDSYLAQEEAQFPDIRPDLQKGIVWANPHQKAKTAVSVVYLHGYTASRKEIFPAVDLIGQQLKANVFYTRLAGHSRTPEAHKTVTAEDWFDDTVEALEIAARLGEKVVVVGTSSGATLAAWIALGQLQDRVSAMILVSPNLTPQDPNADILLWPGNDWIVPLVVGDTVEFKTVFNEMHRKWWDWRHSSHSFIPMMQTVDLMRKKDFSPWKIPTLVFYDLEDKVVNEQVTVKKFAETKSAVTMREVKNPGDPEHHVIVGDARSPAFTATFVQESVQFLKDKLALTN